MSDHKKWIPDDNSGCLFRKTRLSALSTVRWRINICHPQEPTGTKVLVLPMIRLAVNGDYRYFLYGTNATEERGPANFSVTGHVIAAVPTGEVNVLLKWDTGRNLPYERIPGITIRNWQIQIQQFVNWRFFAAICKDIILTFIVHSGTRRTPECIGWSKIKAREVLNIAIWRIFLQQQFISRCILNDV